VNTFQDSSKISSEKPTSFPTEYTHLTSRFSSLSRKKYHKTKFTRKKSTTHLKKPAKIWQAMREPLGKRTYISEKTYLSTRARKTKNAQFATKFLRTKQILILVLIRHVIPVSRHGLISHDLQDLAALSAEDQLCR
jgi:hypothetical protein